MEEYFSEIHDLVVYGSSGAGFAGALQAARDGLKVILVEPGPRIGGMTTGGLGATDIGDSQTIGGIGREFYRNIHQHYQNPAVWRHESRADYLPKHPFSVDEASRFQFFFEPSAALRVMRDMLAAHGVRVLTMAPLDRTASLRLNAGRIEAIPLKSGRWLRGRYFMDASYEGDLMAMAGVPFFLGREDNQLFGETLNGFLPHPAQDTAHVDPYVIPGDPASGLLPGIEPTPLQTTGSGDARIQAYNFRLCLTDVPENRIPIGQPKNYDPLHYEALARHMLSMSEPCRHFPFFKRTPVPNRKTDSNNFGIFSTDFVGKSHRWPLADDAERARIWQEHHDYTLGLLWFLGNDPRFPESWRAEVRTWGLARDEFVEAGNWPPQLYVREARRMRSGHVITEHNCRESLQVDDPVALGSYAMDSHQVSRFVDEEGRLRAEGGFWKTCAPYPVSYRAIVPPRQDCANLVVPVCLSATHAAYGSIRMEPVFMMLGQAGAVAIAIALRDNRAVQSVDFPTLKTELLASDAILHRPEEILT